MLAELKGLRDDPFYTPVAHTNTSIDKNKDTSLESLGSAVPLVTGNVQRLESFRRNWLAMLDHLNQAIEIVSLDHSRVQAERRAAEEYSDEKVTAAAHAEEGEAVKNRRKETIMCLLSASELIKLMRVLLSAFTLRRRVASITRTQF